MPASRVLWVTVETSNGKRTYYVSQNEPGSPTAHSGASAYGDVSTQPIAIDLHLFSTYSDLCTYIRSFGIDPPAETYFEPNDKDIDYERTEWIRRVPAC